MEKVTECILPVIVGTQDVLLVCSYPPNYLQLVEGDYAYIDCLPVQCPFGTICMQGIWVDITCLTEIPNVELEASQNKDKVTIYPTLTNDIITITGQDVIGIEIYSSNAILALSPKVKNSNEISLSNLSAGFYFVKIITKNKIYFSKIVKI